MKRLNILGCGIMGTQISALFYNLGFEVCIYTRKTKLKELEFQAKVLSKKLNLKPMQKGSFCFYTSIKSLPEALCIECLAENLELKKECIKEFQNSHQRAIFSNSSSFSSKDLNCGLLHFFNPIYLKLIELYDPKNEALTLIQDLKELDFCFIKAKGNRGNLANLLLFNEISNFFKMIEKLDYSLQECELVYEKLYEKRDILGIIDIIGVAICDQICLNLHEQDLSFYYPKSFKKALELGILGRKNKTKIKDFLLTIQEI
ncbi:3-hydroxyacyl-CoA dehydrogenase NAD-binding domain-containing protein [Campylobacter sp. MIT 97-5078]|uniref:3-hydroxyacyl-CoA dehydrogenase NAD-binding domain-containing protein n=1 Tax=Campylobacter sp. MIT 97-5078 TaxID=1548153 RepID=UPI0005137111|nr:3-hydroxyacyl-CoA dehydrogenase NAD-binding domain-containing protein [Campylobacter sp. MIT 97-5078]KGI55911.1 hypothetical protein LR59_09770 [Campylobacter sp. MIT 97-5078]TQR27647.1 hypothetical protein DMB91_03385 [Campylobacter sp. MIT 97-5078]